MTLHTHTHTWRCCTHAYEAMERWRTRAGRHGAHAHTLVSCGQLTCAHDTMWPTGPASEVLYACERADSALLAVLACEKVWDAWDAREVWDQPPGLGGVSGRMGRTALELRGTWCPKVVPLTGPENQPWALPPSSS